MKLGRARGEGLMRRGAQDRVRAAVLNPIVRVGNLPAEHVCCDARLWNDGDIKPMGAISKSIAVDFQRKKGGIAVAQRADAVVGVVDVVVSENGVDVPVFQQ